MLQMERYTLNYQLFKRNNMKKYLSLVMIGLSLMLSGCNKDDNNDPDTPPTGDTGKVRYEATVSDPENFKLLIQCAYQLQPVIYQLRSGALQRAGCAWRD